MSYPLEDRYPVSVTIAILALAPYVVLTTAADFYQQQLMRDLATTRLALELISGLSTAAYAFGALLAGDLTNRFRQRLLFFMAEAAFVIGSLVIACASSTLAYGSGSVLQGFATGLLLVITLPPVIRRFPAERMPLTAAFVNIGFFGAVTAGPLLGGVVAAAHAWRIFYDALAVVGITACVLAALTFPDQPPPRTGLPFDAAAIALGAVGTILPFWAVGRLTDPRVHFDSVVFWLPLALGLSALVVLLLTEYHRKEPLSPVKLMWSTFPVTGTVVAMLGGAVYVSLVMLPIQWLLQSQHVAPLQAGLSFWPQLVGVLLAAIILRAVLPTRYLPLLILAGLLTLLGGALLLRAGGGAMPMARLAAVGLLGLGAGATVSPGMYLAGFAVPSPILGRVFALVELVRSVADFLLAPMILKAARLSSHAPSLTAAGLQYGLWITLLIALASIALALTLYLSGCPGLPQPQIDAWLKHEQVAIRSPALAARWR